MGGGGGGGEGTIKLLNKITLMELQRITHFTSKHSSKCFAHINTLNGILRWILLLSPFTDEESRAPKGCVICPGRTPNNGDRS